MLAILAASIGVFVVLWSEQLANMFNSRPWENPDSLFTKIIGGLIITIGLVGILWEFTRTAFRPWRCQTCGKKIDG